MPSVFRRSNKVNPQVDGPAPFDLIPVDDLVPLRRPYGSRNLRLSFEGRVSTPIGMFSQVLPEGVGVDIRRDDLSSSPIALDAGEDVGDVGDDSDDAVEVKAREARALKRQRQWRKWSEDIIPALLQPYMALLRETDGLRDINSKREVNGCVGCSDGRLLNVTCVYFESMDIVWFIQICFWLITFVGLEKVTLCTCTEPALQLLQCGFFPCAPQEPSLAVDLGVLEFAQDLFINAAPNTTAWCETLEGFLSARRFKLTTRVCIHIVLR